MRISVTMKQKEPSPLRHLRRARTLSQAELAALADIGRLSIVRAEQGKQELGFAVKARIAAILGSSVADLFPEKTL